jgi:hypothetical protein
MEILSPVNLRGPLQIRIPAQMGMLAILSRELHLPVSTCLLDHLDTRGRKTQEYRQCTRFNIAGQHLYSPVAAASVQYKLVC